MTHHEQRVGTDRPVQAQRPDLCAPGKPGHQQTPLAAAPSTPVELPADLVGLRIALLGPVAPPAGGMANQTQQLLQLLCAAGINVQLVPTNAPYRPRWIAGIRGLRALCRLAAYLCQLWRICGRVDLLHIMANSGWSWHLAAAPAIWIARLRGVGVLVNFRGGEAMHFLARRTALLLASLHRCDALVVPSTYLQRVFEAYGLGSCIVPNVIDPQNFYPPAALAHQNDILMTRHLEALYDHGTALRTLVLVRRSVPDARLVICGEGRERGTLEQLAQRLGIGEAVLFTGPLSKQDTAQWYRSARVALNTSLVDNAPNAVLEAWACAVPVVSTAVGGIPYLVRDGVDGLLVAAGQPELLARQILRLLQDPPYAASIAAAGLERVQQHRWEQLAPRWYAQYRRILLRPTGRGYTGWISARVFPLHEKLKRHLSVALRKRLEVSQWWSPEQLARSRNLGLRALLQHAVQHVPYYRQLSATGQFDVARIHTEADLAQLPILRKAAINQQLQAFVAETAGPLQRMSTGGSSGMPLHFYIGQQRVSHDVAAKWRATRWWGVDIGDREALMWGSPIELSKQDRWRHWRDRILRSELFPAFDLTPARLDSYLTRLQGHPPRMLFGYPSALCALARHAALRNVALDQIGVKVIFVTAERLYDEQRNLLERCFGAPVANGYGGRDAGFIAHQCPEGGMHLCAEDIIVEIVDENDQPLSDGEPGEIIVTHLASADFPFIRYATGDRGAIDPQPCRCGRSLPLLKQLDGRSTDFVVASDGTVMHGLALIYIMRELNFVVAFKIIQESLLEFRVLLVLDGGVTPDLQTTLVEPFRQRLGSAVQVLVELVSEIPAEASGKFRYVVNRMPSN